MLQTCKYDTKCYRKNLMHYYQNIHTDVKFFNHNITGLYDNIKLHELFECYNSKIVDCYIFTYDLDLNFLYKELSLLDYKLEKLYIILDSRNIESDYDEILFYEKLQNFVEPTENPSKSSNIKIIIQKGLHHSKLFLFTTKFLNGPNLNKLYLYFSVSTANIVDFHWGENTIYSNLSWVSPL